MCQEPVLELRIKVTGIHDEIRIFFEEINRKRLCVLRSDKVTLYFVDSKKMFPLLALGSILSDFGVEFFWNAVEGEAVVCAKDELLFEPEAFLEFFDVCEKVNNLGGNLVNEFCRFKPIIIC